MTSSSGGIASSPHFFDSDSVFITLSVVVNHDKEQPKTDTTSLGGLHREDSPAGHIDSLALVSTAPSKDKLDSWRDVELETRCSCREKIDDHQTLSMYFFFLFNDTFKCFMIEHYCYYFQACIIPYQLCKKGHVWGVWRNCTHLQLCSPQANRVVMYH